MRYLRAHSRFKNHRRLQAAGGVFTIAGLSSGIRMARLSGVPRLHYARSILGETSVPTAATIAPGPVDIALGLSMLPPIVALLPYVTEDECCT